MLWMKTWLGVTVGGEMNVPCVAMNASLFSTCIQQRWSHTLNTNTLVEFLSSADHWLLHPHFVLALGERWSKGLAELVIWIWIWSSGARGRKLNTHNNIDLLIFGWRFNISAEETTDYLNLERYNVKIHFVLTWTSAVTTYDSIKNGHVVTLFPNVVLKIKICGAAMLAVLLLLPSGYS